jgi:hypothetical protein
VEALCRRFNEPIMPSGTIRKWLDRFADEDKPDALSLLERIEFHSYPRLVRETKLLHGKLRERLASGGFDAGTFTDVDFSREFTCKSGDFISYIYRKANLIPAIDFKTFDQLIRETDATPGKFKNRALIILDDYIGTGSQFIFQFIGRSEADIRVVNSYRRTYLSCIVAHENALQKFNLLAEGKIEQVIAIEEAQFPDVDFRGEEDHLRRALASLDWKKIEFVYLDEETPLLSPENRSLSDDEKRRIEHLLTAYRDDGIKGFTSYLMGHHAFFYGAPNSLPAILLPLFKRVEDLSTYDTEKITGVSGDVIAYDINGAA